MDIQKTIKHSPNSCLLGPPRVEALITRRRNIQDFMVFSVRFIHNENPRKYDDDDDAQCRIVIHKSINNLISCFLKIANADRFRAKV